MKLLPPFEERSFPEQLIAAIVVPMVFGIVTGLALGWNGIVYWILVGRWRSSAVSWAAWTTAEGTTASYAG